MSSSQPSGKIRGLRLDIQALRAVAVLLVVINHFWPARLTGGYVGVDIFFVVSGFLITSHLLKEIRTTGGLGLGRFYARRARRLLPAAYIVALASLAATVAFMPLARWRETAVEVFASAAYFQNWLLAGNAVDYSASNGAATPVQHYWSLSVEEQFYLVWPILLLAGVAVSRRRGKRLTAVLAAIVIAVGIMTFAYAIYSTATNRSEAYFLTQNRVWEFAAGAMIALYSAPLLSFFQDKPRLQGITQWVGLLMLGVAAISFDQETMFPGPWAIIPVTGTLLIIGAGPGIPSFSILRPLKSRPVQYIGDVSYSLYLWHWPLLIIAPFAIGRDLLTADRLVLLVVALVLAGLTKRYVEDPARLRLLVNASHPKFFALLAASLVMILTVSALTVFAGQTRIAAAEERLKANQVSACFGAQSLPPREECGDPFASVAEMPIGDNETPWFDVSDCVVMKNSIHVGDELFHSQCDFSKGSSDPFNVWLVGDSHAEQWKAAIYQIADEQGWLLNVSLVGGCPLVDVPRVSFMGGPPDAPQTQERCLEWGAQLTQTLTKEKPDLVIASTFASAEEIDDATGRTQLEQYADATSTLLSKWTESGTQVAVLRDVPLTLSRSTPDCLALNMSSPIDCATDRAVSLPPDPFAEGALAMGVERVSVVDLTDRFCVGELCYALIGGVPVYYDDNHISRSYSLSLSPALKDALRLSIGLPLD